MAQYPVTLPDDLVRRINDAYQERYPEKPSSRGAVSAFLRRCVELGANEVDSGASVPEPQERPPVSIKDVQYHEQLDLALNSADSRDRDGIIRILGWIEDAIRARAGLQPSGITVGEAVRKKLKKTG